jgi:hypothetical protein
MKTSGGPLAHRRSWRDLYTRKPNTAAANTARTITTGTNNAMPPSEPGGIFGRGVTFGFVTGR